MNTIEQYTFGLGNKASAQYLQSEERAFEDFLRKILTPEQLISREQLRSMESAIKIVVDEIMDTYENQVSD